MSTQIISLSLDPENAAVLDLLAAQAGVSRSEMCRRIIRMQRKPIELRTAEQCGARAAREVYLQQLKEKAIRAGA